MTPGEHARSIVRAGLADVRDQTGEETREQATYQPRHAADLTPKETR